MQIGSPGRNSTGMLAAIIFQFMVNVAADQSVSITPSSGTTPGFHMFAGPRAQRL